MLMQGLGYRYSKKISDHSAAINNKSLHCQANWGWAVFGEEKLVCQIRPKSWELTDQKIVYEYMLATVVEYHGVCLFSKGFERKGG